MQESVEAKQVKDALDIQAFIHPLENLESPLPTLHDQIIELEEVQL